MITKQLSGNFDSDGILELSIQDDATILSIDGSTQTPALDYIAVSGNTLIINQIDLGTDVKNLLSLNNININGTPDGTKFLRDDGSWADASIFENPAPTTGVTYRIGSYIQPEGIGNYSTISGGLNNKTATAGQFATIAGGNTNIASGSHSSIIGGANNKTVGSHSVVLGGSNNIASADYSIVSGKHALSGTYVNTFSWSDGLGGATQIPNDNYQVAFKASGGLRLIDGNQLAGRVLTSDSNGVGKWADAISGITGVSKESGSVITRPTLNFIEGTNISLTIADDPINNEVDITISSTGGGSGGSSATSWFY